MLRTVIAFLVAPLMAPLVLMIYLSGMSGGRNLKTFIALYTTAGAYAAMLTLGLGFYLLLRRRGTPRWITFVLGGIVIAIVSWLFFVLVFPMLVWRKGPVDLWGNIWLLGLFEAFILPTIMGGLSATLFWLVARPDRRPVTPVRLN